jgi:hypothetical protein
MMKIDRRSILIRTLILLALAAISIGLVEIAPIRAHLELDQFQKLIGEAGLMGPALLVMFCAIGGCLFVPVTVFVVIGVAMFGPYLGFTCAFRRGSDLLSYCPQAGKGVCLFPYRRKAEELRRPDRIKWLQSRPFPPADVSCP